MEEQSPDQFSELQREKKAWMTVLRMSPLSPAVTPFCLPAEGGRPNKTLVEAYDGDREHSHILFVI